MKTISTIMLLIYSTSIFAQSPVINDYVNKKPAYIGAIPLNQLVHDSIIVPPNDLRPNWSYRTKEYSCKVRFAISKDGEILKVGLGSGSQGEVFNDQLIAALFNAKGWTAPVLGREKVAGYSESIEINFTMDEYVVARSKALWPAIEAQLKKEEEAREKISKPKRDREWEIDQLRIWSNNFWRIPTNEYSSDLTAVEIDNWISNHLQGNPFADRAFPGTLIVGMKFNEVIEKVNWFLHVYFDISPKSTWEDSISPDKKTASYNYGKVALKFNLYTDSIINKSIVQSCVVTGDVASMQTYYHKFYLIDEQPFKPGVKYNCTINTERIEYSPAADGKTATIQVTGTGKPKP